MASWGCKPDVHVARRERFYFQIHFCSVWRILACEAQRPAPETPMSTDPNARPASAEVSGPASPGFFHETTENQWTQKIRGLVLLLLFSFILKIVFIITFVHLVYIVFFLVAYSQSTLPKWW